MREWLIAVAPAWARPWVSWALHPSVLIVLSGVSLFLFVASVLAIPWFVSRLPADYFSRNRDRPSLIENPRTRTLFHVGKNVVGVVLLLAGIAMLVLPGQGMLTIVVALILIEFPGKHRLQRRLVSRPGILRALNALRRRAGREPLVLE
jgi:hypothetical protein